MGLQFDRSKLKNSISIQKRKNSSSQQLPARSCLGLVWTLPEQRISEAMPCINRLWDRRTLNKTQSNTSLAEILKAWRIAYAVNSLNKGHVRNDPATPSFSIVGGFGNLAWHNVKMYILDLGLPERVGSFSFVPHVKVRLNWASYQVYFSPWRLFGNSKIWQFWSHLLPKDGKFSSPCHFDIETDTH